GLLQQRGNGFTVWFTVWFKVWFTVWFTVCKIRALREDVDRVRQNGHSRRPVSVPAASAAESHARGSARSQTWLPGDALQASGKTRVQRKAISAQHNPSRSVPA